MAQQNCQETDYATEYIRNVTLKVTVFLGDLFALFFLSQKPSAWGIWSVFQWYWLGLWSTSMLGKIHDGIYS